jgi:hypothetical protein
MHRAVGLDMEPSTKSSVLKKPRSIYAIASGGSTGYPWNNASPAGWYSFLTLKAIKIFNSTIPGFPDPTLKSDLDYLVFIITVADYSAHSH